MQEIIKNIYSLSSSLGFVDFGIASANELVTEIEHYNNSMKNGYFADMNYLSKNLEKRFNPKLLFEGAKSILVFLAPYGDGNNSNICKDTPLINVASYAWGEDYHLVIKNKLQIILNRIITLAKNYKEENDSTPDTTTGRVFTDSAPILERAWAVKAGLGFIGKNNFLISRKVGIRTLIGVIIVNIELPQSIKTDDKNYCGNCTKCLDACPTGALCAPYNLDARKCISYNTIENKQLSQILELQNENKKSLNFNGWYFGCDVCMNACPWNRKNITGWPELLTNKQLLSTATNEWWKNLSGEEFKTIFASSPFMRTGLKNIQASHILNTRQNINE
ncbi:MAG: tRNA epoxyqueuosine(34) reductase QueG [Bacteroidales bacterium]